MIDTTMPTVSSLVVTDTSIASASYGKTGDAVSITAALTNTDATKIQADLSQLTGNASHTGVVCSAPPAGISCSYAG